MLSKEDFQFILLGSGDAYLESSFLKLKESFPDRIGVRIGFDDTLARRIFAGSDFFVMPSRLNLAVSHNNTPYDTEVFQLQEKPGSGRHNFDLKP